MPLLEFDARLQYPSGFRLDVRFASDGPVVGIFGPSGSGKTSVLSIIAGLRRPQSGLIVLCERALFDGRAGVNLAPELRRIGYVFQDHLLFPHLSVRGNLLYGRRRANSTARLKSSPISTDRVVEVLELSDLLERSPHTLSGGQKQRVALGRALLANPELLLLDEPLSSVDDALKDKVLVFIQRALAEWRVPTVYVTHQAGELKRLGASVIRLEDGKLAGDCLPEAGP